MPLGPGALSAQRRGTQQATDATDTELTDPPPVLPHALVMLLTPSLAPPPADTVHAVDAHAAQLLGGGACMPTDDAVEREGASAEYSHDAQVFGTARDSPILMLGEGMGMPTTRD